jgi:hypothetical protein
MRLAAGCDHAGHRPRGADVVDEVEYGDQDDCLRSDKANFSKGRLYPC